MKRFVYLSNLLIVVLSCICCQKDDVIHPLLEGSWTNSFEEEVGELIGIYRPNDYKEFPTSRYRQRFVFGDNNVCHYSVLAPNDAHYMAEGRWHYDGRTKMLRITDLHSSTVYEFKVLASSQDLLRLSHH